ncbi:Dehydrogenase/reductase SDR family member 11 [Portunus trituberculatus]|uniref:Dehydrogenase/reductase SDR family member 11 n=1 Tax=Portunus trituberculatus TaxID=210409 RepID=A0A5B7HT08_PORTR|nr:Dehydrogenase/reductase SDR family member 11 [Portunus trituberculatus]
MNGSSVGCPRQAISPGLVETEFIMRTGRSPEAARQLYQEMPSLQPDDVTDSLIHALSAPPSVQVNIHAVACV